MLHNQLQILVRLAVWWLLYCSDGCTAPQVKSECGEEEEMDIQSQVIASLQQQLQDMQQSVDCLRQSDQNLRLSLRMAEQRAQEAEAKLAHCLNR